MSEQRTASVAVLDSQMTDDQLLYLRLDIRRCWEAQGGRLLVHPSNNPGFRNFDPPCRKCWERYSRPYTGALAYTLWSSSSQSTTSHSSTNFQHPLPLFRPPQLARAATSALAHSQAHNCAVFSSNLSLAQTQVSPFSCRIRPSLRLARLQALRSCVWGIRG